MNSCGIIDSKKEYIYIIYIYIFIYNIIIYIIILIEISYNPILCLIIISIFYDIINGIVF